MGHYFKAAPRGVCSSTGREPEEKTTQAEASNQKGDYQRRNDGNEDRCQQQNGPDREILVPLVEVGERHAGDDLE